MMALKQSIAVLVLFAVGVAPSSAGVRDWLRGLSGGDNADSSSGVSAGRTSAGGTLSQTEIVDGLKQALSKGMRNAVDQLGRPNGFLNDARVRIPLPKTLQTVEKTLRSLGQERYADEFVATMNHAAEKAVAQAGPIFRDALRKLSVRDAMDILKGPNDAATRFFRNATQQQLRDKMLPIVSKATDSAGVTGAYKSMLDKLGFARSLVGDNMGDIDQYVTGKSLDGLFLMISDEERRIRENPVARTTELLRKVFSGAVQR